MKSDENTFSAEEARALANKAITDVALFRKEVQDVLDTIMVAAGNGDLFVHVPKLPWQITYRLEQLGYTIVDSLYSSHTTILWSD